MHRTSGKAMEQVLHICDKQFIEQNDRYEVTIRPIGSWLEAPSNHVYSPPQIMNTLPSNHVYSPMYAPSQIMNTPPSKSYRAFI